MTYSDNCEYFLFHIFYSLAGRIRQEKQIKAKRLEGRKNESLFTNNMVSMKEYLKIPQLNIIFSKKICEEF